MTNSFVIVILLAFVVFLIACMWKIFEKAGRPGWEAIVPIYNLVILMKIIGKPAWWVVLLIIPFVNYIFSVWSTNMLSKSFGKTEGFTAGLIFLPFIFYPMLAFDKSIKYLGPFGDPEAFKLQNMNKFDFDKTI